MSANKIKRITYLTSEIAERRQESRTSDGAVKITRQKWYQLGLENVSLKGLSRTAKFRGRGLKLFYKSAVLGLLN